MRLRKLLERRYLYWILGIAFSYIIINIFLSKFYLTLWYLPYFLDTINWKEFVVSTSFAILVGILVAANMVTAYLHYQENKHHVQNKSCIAKDKRATFFASIGAVIGLITGICSACTPIILPFLFSIFGVSVTWSSIGIKGLYVQGALILLLLLNLYYFQWHENNKQHKEGSK